MKAVLFIAGSIALAVISYFLYQHQLGAIPFLIVSVALFYLGYRLIHRSERIQEGSHGEEEQSEKSTSVKIETGKK